MLTSSPQDQQSSLSSIFTLLEHAITHIYNEADSGRLEMQEKATAAQLKEEVYKEKVE
jgi:Tfp pilus assembly protein PilO